MWLLLRLEGSLEPSVSRQPVDLESHCHYKDGAFNMLLHLRVQRGARLAVGRVDARGGDGLAKRM